MDALIGDLDRRFPGIAAVVTQREMATARTLRHYLGTPQGEVYGFRPTPERMFAPSSNATDIRAWPLDRIGLHRLRRLCRCDSGRPDGGPRSRR